MRLISENNKLDIPYEYVTLSIVYISCTPNRPVYQIMAYPMLAHEAPIVIAEYRTLKRAMEVMNELRDAYTHSQEFFYFPPGEYEEHTR